MAKAHTSLFCAMVWSGHKIKSRPWATENANGTLTWLTDLLRGHKARVLLKSLLYDYKREAWITNIGDMQARAVVGAGSGVGGEELPAK